MLQRERKEEAHIAGVSECSEEVRTVQRHFVPASSLWLLGTYLYSICRERGMRLGKPEQGKIIACEGGWLPRRS